MPTRPAPEQRRHECPLEPPGRAGPEQRDEGSQDGQPLINWQAGESVGRAVGRGGQVQDIHCRLPSCRQGIKPSHLIQIVMLLHECTRLFGSVDAFTDQTGRDHPGNVRLAEEGKRLFLVHQVFGKLATAVRVDGREEFSPREAGQAKGMRPRAFHGESAADVTEIVADAKIEFGVI